MSGPLSQVGEVLGLSSQPSDDVSILANGVQVSGWLSVVIRIGIEIMPGGFELEITEPVPGSSTALTILEGSSCQIMIGSDLVITGYVVTVFREMTPESHTVRVTGASKSIDLVECSAEFTTFSANNTAPLALAQKLAAPFGINVVPLNYKPDPQHSTIQQFSVILSETPYAIIERICRFGAVLFYDQPDGNIAFSPVGQGLAASGFVENENCERWSFSRSLAGRFSTVQVVLMTTDTLFNSPDTSDLTAQLSNITSGQPVKDAGVQRYRPLLVLGEMGGFNATFAQQRAQWEVNRRYGRSQAVTVTCDSWRDSAGKLWTPNTLAPVSLPSVKCTPTARMLISEVVFRRDADGTHADIVLMPPQAFAPEPIVLNPMAADVAQAERQNAASADPTITQEDLPPPGAVS